MDLHRVLTIFLSVLVLTGCGGGSSDGESGSTSPFEVSPGGIWATASPSFYDPGQALVGVDFDSLEIGSGISSEIFIDAELADAIVAQPTSATFYISENGKFVFQQIKQGSISSGIGQITESDSNGIVGNYRIPGFPAGIGYGAVLYPISINWAADCELSGTVVERELLYLSSVCTDVNGDIEESTLDLLPIPDCSSGFCDLSSSYYETSSSLSAIAGDYEPAFTFFYTTNQISISPSGVVTGTYSNGQSCDLNGTISTIDEDFNLYDIEWTLSNCESDFFDGETYEGFATTATGITSDLDQLYILMPPSGSESLSNHVSMLYTALPQ